MSIGDNLAAKDDENGIGRHGHRRRRRPSSQPQTRCKRVHISWDFHVGICRFDLLSAFISGKQAQNLHCKIIHFVKARASSCWNNSTYHRDSTYGHDKIWRHLFHTLHGRYIRECNDFFHGFLQNRLKHIYDWIA